MPIQNIPSQKFPNRVAVKVKPEFAESSGLDPHTTYHIFFNADFPKAGRKWDNEDKVWRYMIEEKLFTRRLYSERIFDGI